MTFHSRAHPDQRRRRVLLDDTRGTESSVPLPARPIKRSRRYSDDALGDAQPRVTDFLPGNWRGVVGILSALLCGDLIVGALAWFRATWLERLPELPLGLIDGQASHNLASLWLTSQGLLAIAMCLLIFCVRRRRLDDLRGTYQLWIWSTAGAVLLLFFSTSQALDLLAYGISRIPGAPELAPTLAYGWLIAGLFYVPWTLRLLVEMRRVRSAQVTLVGAGLLLIAIQALALIPLPDRIAKELHVVLPLTASSLLCASLLIYGRYVKLDAQGAFQRPKKKRKQPKIEEEREEQPTDEDVAEEKPSGRRFDAPQPVAQRPGSIGAAISAARTTQPDDDSRGPLSKANRKQLRR